MDSVDQLFIAVFLVLGTVMVGIGIASIVFPEGRHSADRRIAAGVTLLGVSTLVRAPMAALPGAAPRAIADAISLLVLLFSLAGSGLTVWALVESRRNRAPR